MKAVEFLKRALRAVGVGGAAGSLEASEADDPTRRVRELEGRLQGIWREVLALEEVPLDASFFDLGGTSLRAVLMLARAREQIGVDIPLETLFESGSIARLAELAARNEQAAAQGEDVWLELSGEGDGTAIPLSPGQQRLWFLDRYRGAGSAYNIPIALRIRGPLDVAALRRSFAALLARHDVLRTSFALQHGRPCQVIAAELTWELRLRDLADRELETAERELIGLAQAEALRSFDLERGPLVRGELVRLAEGDHVLLLTVHHIVFDGWSLGVLLRELAALYAGFLPGARPARLPELRVQYADYARWQQRSVADGAYAKQIAYWRKQLHGARPLSFPADPRHAPLAPGAGPAGGGADARSQFLRIEADVVQRLKRIGEGRGSTFFMVLLAAFKVLLCSWTRQADLCVGVPVAGRTRVEFEPLLGFFVNTLVMRTDLSANPRFTELLNRVRKGAVLSYANQDVPFDQLVAALGGDRDAAAAPLFQVMFALQNAPMEPPTLQGLELAFVALEGQRAKFDLTASMTEAEGELFVQLEYRIDRFADADIETRLKAFSALLGAVAADSELRLDELLRGVGAEPPELSPVGSEPAAPAVLDAVDAPVGLRPNAVFEAPRTPLERDLAELWKELLAVEQLGVQDHFFQLGGSSLGAVLLMARVHERFGVEVPLEIFFDDPTVAGLARLVETHSDGAIAVSAPPIASRAVLLRDGLQARPLFCVHALAGDAQCYRQLADALAPAERTYGLELALRDEQALGSIEQLAALHVQTLREIQKEGPYLLCGWSSGGIVAFEMARQLERDGERVELLALIDANAHVIGAKEALEETVPGAQGAAAPAEAQRRALQAYRPEAYRGRTTLLRTKQHANPHLRARSNGWRSLSPSGLEVYELPGDHYSMLEAPHVQALASRLQIRLDQARLALPPEAH